MFNPTKAAWTRINFFLYTVKSNQIRLYYRAWKNRGTGLIYQSFSRVFLQSGIYENLYNDCDCKHISQLRKEIEEQLKDHKSATQKCLVKKFCFENYKKLKTINTNRPLLHSILWRTCVKNFGFSRIMTFIFIKIQNMGPVSMIKSKKIIVILYNLIII